MCDVLIILLGAHGEYIAATVTVYKSHHISTVDVTNGCLYSTASANNVKGPDTLVERCQHRVLKQREREREREREKYR